MKLHYSQTAMPFVVGSVMFYYLMKLHYSQTKEDIGMSKENVLLPYEITLFSNLK